MMPNNDLISRAELARDLSYSAPELFFDKDYLMTKIARQPAVDAIPVEWLLKKKASCLHMPSRASQTAWLIGELIKEWQREQEG